MSDIHGQNIPEYELSGDMIPALWVFVWAVGATVSFGLFLSGYMLFTARVLRSLSPAHTGAMI